MLYGDLGVVPIFVNAGAALAPAFAASLATFFALLFKPKALFKACMNKPIIPIIVLVVIGAITTLFILWPAPHANNTGRGRSLVTTNAGGHGGIYVDWTSIALARIEAKTKGNLVAPQPVKTPLDSSLSRNSPFIFRGSPSRLGAEGSSPDGSLSLLWSYYPSWTDLDGSVQRVDTALMLSSPAVMNNRVYAASCELDPPNSYGIIFCLDAMTGKTIWSVDEIKGEELIGFFSSPALTADGQYVIIGQGLHPDTNCNLICLNAADGRVHWTVQTELHIESSPVIEDGVVYVGAGAIEDPTTKKPISHPGYVMAVKIETGEVLWEHDVIDPESSPVFSDGVLYIGSGMNGKAVVAMKTAPQLSAAERELWKTPAPYPITAAVTLSGDRVLICGGNGDFVFRAPDPAGIIMALDKKSGEIIWSSEMPDAVLGAVAAAEKIVAPVASGVVVALDPETGETLWSTSINGKAPVLAATSVVDGKVYAVSNDGYMAVLSLEDGSILERIYINEKTRPGEQSLSISSPYIYHGKIFVGSETGGLRCYVGE